MNNDNYKVSEEVLLQYKIIIEDLGKYKCILGKEPGTGKSVIVLDSSLTPEEIEEEVYCLINDIGTKDFTEEGRKEFDKYRDSKYDKLIEKISNMKYLQELNNEERGILKEILGVINGKNQIEL